MIAREKKTVLVKTLATVCILDVIDCDLHKKIENKKFRIHRKLDLNDLKEYLREKNLDLVEVKEIYREQKTFRVPVYDFEFRCNQFEDKEKYKRIDINI